MKIIVQFFLDNPKLSIVITCGLLVFGLMGLKKMNAESFPQVSMSTAVITTVYDGATTEDVETKITKPIEDSLRGVSGIKDVRSISRPALSTIVVRIDMDRRGVDVKEALEEVQKAVDRTTKLPVDLKDRPVFTEIKSEEFPVFELAIAGSNDSRKRDLLAERMQEAMEDLTSVKEVRLVGHSPRIFAINIRETALKKYDLTVEQVLRAVELSQVSTPSGELKNNDSEQIIRVSGKVKAIHDLKNVVVRATFSGAKITLGEVATIEDTGDDPKVSASYLGEEATLLIVTKKAGEDTIQLVQKLQFILDRFKEQNPDYTFAVFHSEGQKVSDRVAVLKSNAYSGLILVVIFLLIFLPSKLGLLASLSLPLSLLTTLGFMPVFGMNIDAITVLALVIALGMMVDNAVVIAENVDRLMRNNQTPLEAARESVVQLWGPITATALTTIAAFIPMLVTKGVMGQFIKWIPIVVSMSLVFSLMEAFFLLPVRMLLLRPTEKRDLQIAPTFFERLQLRFENFMEKVVERRYFTFCIFAALFCGSFLLMFKFNRFELFPAEQTEIYIARFEAPLGANLKYTKNRILQLSQEIKDLLGDQAQHVVGRAGVSQMDPGDPKAKTAPHVGMVMIYVNDHAKYHVPYTEMIQKLRHIQPLAGEQLSFQELINGPPVGNPIEATLRGENREILRALITELSSKMYQTEGITKIFTDEDFGPNESELVIDESLSSRLGTDYFSLGQMLRTAVSGKRVTTQTIDNKDVDFVVRLSPDDRRLPSQILALEVNDFRGNTFPVASIGSFRDKGNPPYRKRFNFKPAITLMGELDATKITPFSANNQLQQYFEAIKASNPPQYGGVTLVFGGEQESTNESMSSLFDALILSLIGITGLLVFLFKSFLRPLIIMTTIPMGLLGFSLAFYLHGRPISFLALIGVIGLGGIIVNAGIVLISFIDEMRKNYPHEPINHILKRASSVRLKAVMVTALTTISGLLPTAYGVGGSDALLIPMTLAMAWGLTLGTILTLIWIPPAYAILEDVLNYFKR